MTKIISWNVNGIRAVQRKKALDWLEQEKPDIFCIQETKAHPDQLDEELLRPEGYETLWVSAERKGYSGVAAYVKRAPSEMRLLGDDQFDCEGRTMILDYPEFTLLNCYFPNSQPEGARIEYKIAFCNAVLETCKDLVKNGKHVIVCGDFNIAHKPIDLKNPESNEKNPGYLPQERAWMDTFINSGFADSFRMFCSEPGHYTWWSYRFRAREKGVGWRIDYHCVDDAFRDQVKGAAILDQVMGSDHCPVQLTLA